MPRNAAGRGNPARKREARQQGQGQSQNPRKGQSQQPKQPSYLDGPRTPKELGHEVRASTNQKFRPLERAIGAEKRASERRTGEVGDWWQNYLNTVNQGQAATSAVYDQAAATGQAQIGQASAVDNANTAQLQAEAAKSAALRGAAPSNAPAERGAAAQAQRNYLAAAQGGATAQMGANQFAYLTDQKRVGVGQSIASRKEEQRRTSKIEQDRTALARERGDFATTKRGEGIDKEREYLLQRGAFGLDKRKAGLEGREADEAAQHERNEERRKNEAQRNANQEQANQNNAAKSAGKSGGKTPSERNEAREGRQNAMATARSKFQLKKWNSWAELEQAVSKESEVSPSEARWAVKKLRAHVEQKEKTQVQPPNLPFG